FPRKIETEPADGGLRYGAVIGLDEIRGPGFAHCTLHRIPCGAGNECRIGVGDAEPVQFGSGSACSQPAELIRRRCAAGVPEGVADIEEDGAKRHAREATRRLLSSDGRGFRRPGTIFARRRYADKRADPVCGSWRTTVDRTARRLVVAVTAARPALATMSVCTFAQPGRSLLNRRCRSRSAPSQRSLKT